MFKNRWVYLSFNAILTFSTNARCFFFFFSRTFNSKTLKVCFQFQEMLGHSVRILSFFLKLRLLRCSVLCQRTPRGFFCYITHRPRERGRELYPSKLKSCRQNIFQDLSRSQYSVFFFLKSFSVNCRCFHYHSLDCSIYLCIL